MILRLNLLISILGLLIGIHDVAAQKMDFKKCLKRHGLFPKPGSMCKSYYKCTNFVPTEWNCPENQHFNEIINQCDWMENFHCLEKPQSKVCITANGLFLKPETGCKYYYDCCNGKATEKKCPPNKIFDPLKRKCEWQELSICEEDLSTGNTDTTVSSTPEEIKYSTTKESYETSPAEKEYSTTVETYETSSEELKSTTTKESYETSPEEIESSTTKESFETSPEEIESSTKKESYETSPEEIESTTTKESYETSPEEIKSTTTKESYETTPEEFEFSTATESDESTSDEFKYSTTKELDESSSEEIDNTTTTFDEATSVEELQQSTASNRLVGITEDVSLTTFDLSQLTNEPNIFCPKRHGYYPHPFDKHKFVGCVDYIPNILTCPHDLVYNHEQKQCVYEE